VEKKYIPWRNIEVPGIAKIISQTRFFTKSETINQSMQKCTWPDRPDLHSHACIDTCKSTSAKWLYRTVPYICLFRASSSNLVLWQTPCHGSHSTHRLSWHLGISEALTQKKDTTKPHFHGKSASCNLHKYYLWSKYVCNSLSFIPFLFASILTNCSKRKDWTHFHLECLEGCSALLLDTIRTFPTRNHIRNTKHAKD